VRFQHPAQQIVFQDYVDAVTDAEARVERLTGQIADLLPNWSLAPVVEAVQAMRRVAVIVAVTVVAEVGDVHRFETPRQLMAYLGLTPSEHSSGASVRRGGITKAGSGLARRVLIEGAWSYRMQARVSRKLHDRIEALSKVVRDIAWKGQLRMCRRYRHLMAAGKPKVVTTPFVTVEQVAERYGVSTDSIWHWKRNGRFPAPRRVGPNIARWRLADLIEHESIRLDQAVFWVHVRSALTRALAVSTNLRMSVTMATFAGFPASRSAACFALRSGLNLMATRAGM
jgi:predicted DNA-binding transcriptional regulator AlpA